jgi:hypothetical protein
MEYEVSIEEEVANISMKRPHVVVLGAGASRAACPNGDKNGNKLPLMSDFSEIVGLNSLFKKWGLDPKENFENVFSDLFESNETDKIELLQKHIQSYFGSLELPNTPTIYDYLVLSLREKDIVATFNWDPFLMHAWLRSRRAGLSLPKLLFLHGNVAIGYCQNHRFIGRTDQVCPECKETFTPTPLLYPIKQKNYENNEFISNQWKSLQDAFKDAFMITIFGYSGPKSDEAAIKLMKEAWGDKLVRRYEQTTFITKDRKRQIFKNWNHFIHTHHYDIYRDFFESWIAKHPRRTGEAFWNALFENKFIQDNPAPRNLTLLKLYEWYGTFTDAEEIGH